MSNVSEISIGFVGFPFESTVSDGRMINGIKLWQSNEICDPIKSPLTLSDWSHENTKSLPIRIPHSKASANQSIRYQWEIIDKCTIR